MAPSAVWTWLPVASLVLGAVFVLSGARALVAARRRRSSWVPRRGTVVGSRLDDGHVRLQVGYEAGGREVRFWNRTTTGTGIDRVGREVEILVNPADPTDAVVVGGATSPTTAAAVSIAFGVLALAVGVVGVLS